MSDSQGASRQTTQVLAKDGHGFTRALLDDAGEMVVKLGPVNRLQFFSYDAYGNMLPAVMTQSAFTATPDTALTALLYNGELTDGPSGLQYLRARFYDPRMGWFLSEDPSGFASGDYNLYRYAGGDPVNGSDPTGLCRKDWLGLGVGALTGFATTRGI